jgi:hypothetical protein
MQAAMLSTPLSSALGGFPAYELKLTRDAAAAGVETFADGHSGPAAAAERAAPDACRPDG